MTLHNGFPLKRSPYASNWQVCEPTHISYTAQSYPYKSGAGSTVPGLVTSSFTIGFNLLKGLLHMERKKLRFSRGN